MEWFLHPYYIYRTYGDEVHTESLHDTSTPTICAADAMIFGFSTPWRTGTIDTLTFTLLIMNLEIPRVRKIAY